MSEKWAKRFVWTALGHGIIASILTVLFIFPPGGEGLELTRMIAGGSAGTWVFVGYSTYLITGFVGMSAWAFVYYISGEVNEGLSWVHLVLYNVGIIASWLILWAGVTGGTLILQGNPGAVHGAIAGVVQPAGILLGVLILATFIGIANIMIAQLRK